MENQNNQQASQFLFSLFVLMTISYGTMIAFFYVNGLMDLIVTALSAMLIVMIAIALEERFFSRIVIGFVKAIGLKK